MAKLFVVMWDVTYMKPEDVDKLHNQAMAVQPKMLKCNIVDTEQTEAMLDRLNTESSARVLNKRQNKDN